MKYSPKRTGGGGSRFCWYGLSFHRVAQQQVWYIAINCVKCVFSREEHSLCTL